MLKFCVPLIAIVVAACNNEITGLEPPSDPTKETFAPSLGVNISSMTRTATGVFYRDSVIGTGTEVTDKTDSLFVTYGGFLKDGKLFDSGVNVRFLPSEVIAGFRAGMIGMKAGGKRKIVIPSDQGYGSRSITTAKDVKIPRQSTLIFDVEVLKAFNPAPATSP